MTTALLEPRARRVGAKRTSEGKSKIVQPACWGIWPSVALAILFHAGMACLVLPGVPGSLIPALAPLAPRFSSNSTSVELVDELPASPSPSTGAPQPEEQQITVPALLQPPAQPLPKKPLVARQANRQSVAHPAHARPNRLPALGGGLVLSEPPYPLEAKRQGLEGKVTLQVFVQEGRVIWVEVLSSSGHHLLDGNAKQWALHHWRFPGIASGTFTEAVLFSLDGV